ncbi:MAG: tetratricopeptide repeat protein [Moorea sp. SIO4E2]|uniref:tetratricopeptide repeat protein n=1 Tax=Moorena sp. SIO4E2 TaxID=2607826 RepID=UPI0013B89982|nr:tetratricopeptide repeat protein [Moorena sp. SIO4E2]NEQ06421.1 tetratricopeptide repeat protein [Moorena sp. SIO4E2]
MPEETPKTNSAISKLESAIQRYTHALTTLEDASSSGSIPFWQIYLFKWAVESRSYSLMRYVSSKVGSFRSPSKEIVLEVLTARDTVQAELSNQSQIPTGSLIKVNDLDNRLKQETNKITTVVDLTEWHSIFNPNVEAWWWFLEPPKHRWDYLDWLWKILTIVFLILSFSLTVDISEHFLSGGAPDTLEVFVTASEGVLTLLVGRTAFTKTGQELIKNALTRLNIPNYFWQEVICGIAFSLFLICVIVYFLLPKIADFYNHLGDQDIQHNHPKFAAAISDYKRAVALNPDYAESHYHLGTIYEELQENQKALSQYKIAVKDNFIPAYNKLGRMYIIDQKYAQASFWLRRGLDLINEETENDKDNDKEVKYNLLTNLGWAMLEQKYYDEAKYNLENAKKLYNNKAPAYCLLAQVLEAEKNEADEKNTETKNTEIINNWGYCYEYANTNNIDENKWFYQARQHLKTPLNGSSVPAMLNFQLKNS